MKLKLLMFLFSIIKYAFAEKLINTSATEVTQLTEQMLAVQGWIYPTLGILGICSILAIALLVQFGKKSWRDFILVTALFSILGAGSAIAALLWGIFV